jgi:hypothetical protein
MSPPKKLLSSFSKISGRLGTRRIRLNGRRSQIMTLLFEQNSFAYSQRPMTSGFKPKLMKLKPLGKMI